jgi:hypothetical protein
MCHPLGVVCNLSTRSPEDATFVTRVLSSRDRLQPYLGGLPAHIGQNPSTLTGTAFTVLTDQYGHVIGIDPNQKAFRPSGGAA